MKVERYVLVNRIDSQPVLQVMKTAEGLMVTHVNDKFSFAFESVSPRKKERHELKVGDKL